MEQRKELEDILIGLMLELEIPTVRVMLSAAIIRSLNLHEEMIDWVASYYDSEDTITAQSFTAKLNELIEEAKTRA